MSGEDSVPLRYEAGLTGVIVVAANSGPLTANCVDNVLASSAPVELVLVDNASVDGQVDAIENRLRQDSRLRILRNPENLGFGPACNRGAALVKGDALLILNPDCMIGPDTITQLRAVAAEHPRVGILGVQVVSTQGQSDRASRRRDPTLRRAMCSMTGLARWESRWKSLAGVEMSRAQIQPDFEPVDAVSGACLFLPREVFAAVGGFDENYFLHCEDLDLCRRVRDAGYEVLYVHSILLRHDQGSSSQRRPLFVSRHKHRGMWRYFRKFDPAARNPLLRILVWSAIWTHFALLAPLNAWRQLRR